MRLRPDDPAAWRRWARTFGKALEKRQQTIEAWASNCTPLPEQGNVVHFRSV